MDPITRIATASPGRAATSTAGPAAEPSAIAPIPSAVSSTWRSVLRVPNAARVAVRSSLLGPGVTELTSE